MKGFVMMICAVFLGLNSMGQDTRLFKFQGTVYDESSEETLEGFLVDVYQGNDIVSSPETGKKGRFEAELFGGDSYIIDISMNGYYPKRVIVHTTVPEDIKKMPTFKFEIQLIRKSDYELIERVDPFATSIFDFPYVIFEWDSALEDWNYREEYTEHIKDEYVKVDDVQ